MKTTKYALAIALGVVALVAVPAYADTVDYTLNFTTSAGGPTPTGSISYDTATNMISVSVTWDGIMYGGDVEPNDPFGPGSSLLAFLTQTEDFTSCSGTMAIYSWSASTGFGNFAFNVSGPSNCPPPNTIAGFRPAMSGGTPTDPNASASGGWSAALVASPEPSSIILFASGLLGLATAGRRKWFA